MKGRFKKGLKGTPFLLQSQNENTLPRQLLGKSKGKEEGGGPSTVEEEVLDNLAHNNKHLNWSGKKVDFRS